MQPGFAPSFPQGAYPAPRYAGQPTFAPVPAQMAQMQPVAPRTPQTQPATSPYPALAQGQPPARVARGQAPEEPASSPRLPVADSRLAPLTLPSPEALGVRTGPSADGDAVHRRLDQLGATCFHVEKSLQGGYCVSCLLPTREAGRSHRIDVQANTAAEAMRLALDKAEEWVASR